jgi:hypothetical protein
LSGASVKKFFLNWHLLVGVALATIPGDEGVDVELALAPLVVHVSVRKQEQCKITASNISKG